MFLVHRSHIIQPVEIGQVLQVGCGFPSAFRCRDAKARYGDRTVRRSRRQAPAPAAATPCAAGCCGPKLMLKLRMRLFARLEIGRACRRMTLVRISPSIISVTHILPPARPAASPQTGVPDIVILRSQAASGARARLRGVKRPPESPAWIRWREIGGAGRTMPRKAVKPRHRLWREEPLVEQDQKILRARIARPHPLEAPRHNRTRARDAGPACRGCPDARRCALTRVAEIPGRPSRPHAPQPCAHATRAGRPDRASDRQTATCVVSDTGHPRQKPGGQKRVSRRDVPHQPRIRRRRGQDNRQRRGSWCGSASDRSAARISACRALSRSATVGSACGDPASQRLALVPAGAGPRPEPGGKNLASK